MESEIEKWKWKTKGMQLLNGREGKDCYAAKFEQGTFLTKVVEISFGKTYLKVASLTNHCENGSFPFAPFKMLGNGNGKWNLEMKMEMGMM